MEKFAVVGVYGQGDDFTTGQAVKCFELINWLKENFKEENIVVVNTYKWKKRPFKLFYSYIKAFKKCNYIIIMPAQHGLKIFAPLSYYLKKIFKKDVHYVVIGGWLADYLKQNNYMKRIISSFEGVYVETNSMVKKLNSIGLNNCFYLPNTRKIPTNIKKDSINYSKVLKVCTYSRVTEDKGILDAIEIVKKTNELIGETKIKLDIYGKIDSIFKELLEKKIAENNEFVEYCGIKNSNEGVKTLAKYFCLLFPTYYEGEGFAGTILDAFAAGTPVIANDWKYNKEIIEHEKSGFIYSYRNIEEAAIYLVNLYKDENKYKEISKYMKKQSLKYTPDVVYNSLISKIKNEW